MTNVDVNIIIALFVVSLIIGIWVIVYITNILYNIFILQSLTSHIEDFKAFKLFLKHISLRNKISLFIKGKIHTTGNLSKKKYTINTRVSSLNIKRNDDFQFCITSNSVPHWDRILSQYLIIKYHEDKFLRVAYRN